MAFTVGTDSFISAEEAEAYMLQRLHADGWPFAEDPLIWPDGTPSPEIVAENADKLTQKENALRLATVMLSQEVWKGLKTSSTQALAFPRTGIVDRHGNPVAANQIPTDIQHATAELALVLLRHDLTDDKTRRHLYALKRESIGESSSAYESQSGDGDTYPYLVKRLISPYIASLSAVSAPLAF